MTTTDGLPAEGGAVPDIVATPAHGGGRDPKALGLRAVVGLALAVLALWWIPFQNQPTAVDRWSEVLFLAIAAMGLNLLTGFNGQVSIGHGAFFGVGAFTAGVLVVQQGQAPELAIPVAAVLSGLLGVVVGFPALRVKGLYLALVTLGLAVLFPRVTGKFIKENNQPLLKARRSQVDSPFDGLAGDQYRWYLCLAVLVLMFLLARNLLRSRAGRSMIAVRDQEIAASTVGINVAHVKVATFALSAAYAGVAGALSFIVTRTADATNPLIYFQYSIEFLIAVVIGGAATLSGPLLGAAFLVFVRERFRGGDTPAMAPALLGISLMLMVYVLPDGIVGGYRRLLAASKRRRAAPPAGPAGPAVQPTAN